MLTCFHNRNLFCAGFLVVFLFFSLNTQAQPYETLPVEMVYFYGQVEINTVGLYWGTATEVNNYGYFIERSDTIRLWEVLEFIPGHGNSNSPKDYSFIDSTIIANGLYFYRLHQYDTDGANEYTDEIEVYVDFITVFENESITLPLEFNLSQNYPNPFNPITTIEFQIPQNSFVNISVYDLSGRKVMQLLNRSLNAGKYSINVNGSNLASGNYIYRMLTPIYSSAKKLTLLK